MARRLHIFVTLTLLFLVLAGYYYMGVYDPVAYIWATYEDLYGEWAQTLMFALAGLFFLLLAMTKSPYRWFFVLLVAGCFYTVMEEMSWGQRIFGFQTPAILVSHNLQDEANLHNLVVGPRLTELKQFMEWFIATGLVSFGLFYPLLLGGNWRLALWVEKRGVAAPPLYLAPLFLAGAILELEPFKFNEAEVAELVISMAMMIFAAHYWFSFQHNIPVRPSSQWPAGKSGRFAWIVFGLAAITAMGSLAITKTMYSRPGIEQEIKGRIYRGFTYYAPRFERKGKWREAIDLRFAADQLQPDRVLRWLAKQAKQIGKEKKFKRYNDKALTFARDRLALNNNDVSAYLSLAYSYDQRGEYQKATYNSDRGHELALLWVEEAPESAAAAFWLGKSWIQKDYADKGRQQFQRAYTLAPTSAKYREAHLNCCVSDG